MDLEVMDEVGAAEGLSRTSTRTMSADDLAQKLATLASTIAAKLREAVEEPDQVRARFGLDEVIVSVAVTAEGNLGIVKGSATGSIQLRFT
jgi:hypothetical protein